MRVVDSSGWIEFFTDGPLADEYLDHLTPLDDVLTPTIVLYEVFKKIKRECAPEDALIVAAQLTKTHVVDLTSALALEAADRSLDHGLAMGRCDRLCDGALPRGRAGDERRGPRRFGGCHLPPEARPSR